jgi:hypothetical protein
MVGVAILNRTMTAGTGIEWLNNGLAARNPLGVTFGAVIYFTTNMLAMNV